MDPTLADLLTVTGLSGVVTLVMEVVLRALAWPSATVDRFGPLLAVLVGEVLGAGSALVLSASIPQALLVGLVAGCMSQGIQQTIRSAVAVGKGAAG